MKLVRAAHYTLTLPEGGAVTYVRGELLARAHRALVPGEDLALFSAAPRPSAPKQTAPLTDASS